MPKIFIDTNVFLDFYRAKKDSLEILRELYQHSGSIVFPSLVYDEFLRNRVKIIEQVINSLRNEKPKYFTSAIVEGLEVFEDLKRSREEHKKYLDITISKLEEIKEDSKQDDVFLELSKLYKSEKIEIYEHDNSIIDKAQRRHLLGAPPGTDKIKICDEVIWETLLARMNDDILIVSRDSTYKDNYNILSMEFKENTGKNLIEIIDKISSGLKLIGKDVSKEMIELEDKQLIALVVEGGMDRLKYKGYIIHATPYQLAKDKSWSINLHIERHTGSGVADRNFSAANTFPTEAEAIQHCFNFGMQIIDGKAEGCSVDDL